jgi:2'-5' RNA ligase
MRLFFALWPPRETALALEHWARAIEGQRARADKIHLTLAFLGDADAEKAAAAGRRVQVGQFWLPIEEARYWDDNKIAWTGPRRIPEELACLVETLQLELYKEGLLLERRAFVAHVTLVRKATAPQSLPALPRAEWPVKEFVLVCSSGGSYQTLERFSLG